MDVPYPLPLASSGNSTCSSFCVWLSSSCCMAPRCSARPSGQSVRHHVPAQPCALGESAQGVAHSDVRENAQECARSARPAGEAAPKPYSPVPESGWRLCKRATITCPRQSPLSCAASRRLCLPPQQKSSWYSWKTPVAPAMLQASCPRGWSNRLMALSFCLIDLRRKQRGIYPAEIECRSLPAGRSSGCFQPSIQQWIALNHGLSTRQSLSRTIDFGYRKDTNFPPDIIFITQFVSP